MLHATWFPQAVAIYMCHLKTRTAKCRPINYVSRKTQATRLAASALVVGARHSSADCECERGWGSTSAGGQRDEQRHLVESRDRSEASCSDWDGLTAVNAIITRQTVQTSHQLTLAAAAVGAWYTSCQLTQLSRYSRVFVWQWLTDRQRQLVRRGVKSTLVIHVTTSTNSSL